MHESNLTCVARLRSNSCGFSVSARLRTRKLLACRSTRPLECVGREVDDARRGLACRARTIAESVCCARRPKQQALPAPRLRRRAPQVKPPDVGLHAARWGPSLTWHDQVMRPSGAAVAAARPCLSPAAPPHRCRRWAPRKVSSSSTVSPLPLPSAIYSRESTSGTRSRW